MNVFPFYQFDFSAVFSEKQLTQDEIHAAVVNSSFIFSAIDSVLSVYCPRMLSIIFGNGRPLFE